MPATSTNRLIRPSLVEDSVTKDLIVAKSGDVTLPGELPRAWLFIEKQGESYPRRLDPAIAGAALFDDEPGARAVFLLSIG